MIVYKNSGDVAFYVVGDTDENELLLESVLSTLTEAISFLLRYAGGSPSPRLFECALTRGFVRGPCRADETTWNQVDRRTLAENLDYLYLVVDELVDGGCVVIHECRVVVPWAVLLTFVGVSSHSRRIVLESDPKAIADRVAMRDTAAEASGSSSGPISEQTIAKAFSVAKDIFMG